MNMGSRIKDRRKELGLTQEELGQRVGLQKSAIAKYENGRVENMKRSMIEKMSKALDCSPIWLLGIDQADHLTDQQKRILAYVIALSPEDQNVIEIMSHFLHSKVAENAAFFVAVRPDVRPERKKPGSPMARSPIHLEVVTKAKDKPLRPYSDAAL